MGGWKNSVRGPRFKRLSVVGGSMDGVFGRVDFCCLFGLKKWALHGFAMLY